MNQARALWAMLIVAATYLGVTGVFALLAFIGLIPWTQASEVVEAFSALSSLGRRRGYRALFGLRSFLAPTNSDTTNVFFFISTRLLNEMGRQWLSGLE